MNTPSMADGAVDRDGPGLLESLWRFRWSSLAIVVGMAVLGLGAAKVAPPRATATARLALTDPRGASVFGSGNSAAADLARYTAARAGFATSDRVLRRAISILGAHYTVEGLREDVTSSASSTSDVVTVSAHAEHPETAAKIANAVVQAYQELAATDTQNRAATALKAIDETRKRVTSSVGPEATGPSATPSPQRSAASDVLAQLDVRSNDVLVESSLFGAGVDYVDPALVPPKPSSGALRDAGVAALLGFLAAVALAWFRAERYESVEDSDVAAVALGAPLLGSVPELLTGPSKAQRRELAAMPAESYQFVTASLGSQLPSGVVLVTSASRSDGRTVTAANIAVAAARDGRRVLVIDADNRTQGLTQLAGVDVRHPGLVDLANGNAAVQDVIVSVPVSDGASLALMPAGTAATDVASHYRTTKMAQALRWLREQYDVIIFDCPPVLSSADTASLAGHADGILVVVRRGTRMPLLRQVRQRLELFPTRIVGYVFTRDRNVVTSDDSAAVDPRGMRTLARVP